MRPQALAAAAHEEALSFLSEALTLAEPEGYIRTFVDLGEPLRMLIADWRLRNEQQARSTPDRAASNLPNYATRLLTAFDQSSSSARPASLTIPHPQFPVLVEPLTERELEILRLLPTELSTRELAEHLVVSINTIKTQLKSIYAKLGAHSREKAVEKARALNLL